MWKAFFVGLCLSVPGQAGESEWRVWMEPKFMRAPVVAQIPGAQKTVWVAGERREGADVLFAKEPFSALKTSWEAFFAKACANADWELSQIVPHYERDAKKVIQYAALTSKQPVVASAVLGTKFLERFKETMGDKILVVVPNRHTAYVFPALASNYQQYTAMVLRDYRASAYPVSVEVFEVSVQGWRAIGTYEEL